MAAVQPHCVRRQLCRGRSRGETGLHLIWICSTLPLRCIPLRCSLLGSSYSFWSASWLPWVKAFFRGPVLPNRTTRVVSLPVRFICVAPCIPSLTLFIMYCWLCTIVFGERGSRRRRFAERVRKVGGRSFASRAGCSSRLYCGGKIHTMILLPPRILGVMKV